MAATVSPRSSFTSSSGSAQSTAARHRRPASASTAKASSGTAKQISWKSNETAETMPQEPPTAQPITNPATGPAVRWAQRVSGRQASAISAACATSSVTGVGKSRYAGASRASTGWKWSPSRLYPGALRSAIGARPCA